jgi:hypothetical protein
MSILSQIQTGKKIGPPRAVIYGEPKSGKTTFMASIPGIVVIPLEDGQGTLDYARTPQPTDYETLVETLRELATAEHSFKAVGIDGLTGVEELIREKVVRDDFSGSLDKFMAYHKGFTYCAAVWVDFCRELDAVRRRGISIWCAAHSKLETVEDVSAGSYSRMSPQLHKDALAVVVKWSDIIGHIEIERFGAEKKASKDASKSTLTTRTTGVRRLIVEDTGSYMAGNRYGLASPIELPEDNPYAPVRAALMEATGITLKQPEKTGQEAA